MQSDEIEKIVQENPEDPFLGTVVAGKYEIKALIGGGGAGLVYKAKHLMMKKIVAVKVLFPHMVLKPDIVKRFKQEAQSASRLSHPNIVTVYDYGVAERGQPYLVMDYLEGGSLDELVENGGPVDFERARAIFLQACDALAHAHDKGVIHRDLKPSNFMLTKGSDGSEMVKLVDFGLAKAFPQDGETITKLTKTGEVFGSPHYMSPEQCRGNTADQRSDIYAMGCLIYETLVGTPPFVSEDLVEILSAHLSDDPPMLPALKGTEDYIRHRMEAIICKCMAKDPSARYQNAHQLKQDLVVSNLKPGRFDRATTLWKISSLRLKNFVATPQKTAGLILAVGSVFAGIVGSVSYILYGQTVQIKDNPQDLAWQVAKPSAMSAEQVKTSINMATFFLQSTERNSGPNSVDTAEALEKEAHFLQQARKLPDAAQAFQRALKIRQKTDGETSNTTNTTLLNLANCYFEQNMFDSAKPLYEQGLKTIESLWGENSELIPVPLSNLCDIYSHQGRLQEAETGLLRALKILQSSGSDQTVDYALTASRLADADLQLGKWDDAEKYYKMALDFWDQFEGANHQNVIPCYDQLATIAKHKKELNTAEEYLRKEVSLLEKVAGPDNARTGRALRKLADVQWQKWSFIDALSTKARANKILSRKTGTT
jgi:serine/threonine protein kinase